MLITGSVDVVYISRQVCRIEENKIYFTYAGKPQADVTNNKKTSNALKVLYC